MRPACFSPGRSRLRALGWLLAAALLQPTQAPAQPESTVKAAFVFNFLRFTEWPPARFESRQTPLVVCAWAPDARLAESLKTLVGRAVDERPVRVADVDRVDELAQCHALFVPESGAHVVPATLLRKAESLDVLTIGDAEGFAAGGGMIGLVYDGAKMRFEINEKAVKRSNLKLGWQLYQLGRSVAEAPR